MLLPLLILAALSIIVVVNEHYKNRKNKALQSPPGPRGLPIIGNLHEYEHSNTHIYFSKLSKIYGSVFALRLAGKTMVVIHSVKVAKQIFLTGDKNFCDRQITAGRKRLSYNGKDIGFSPYNEYLREMKKVLVLHLLNSSKVQSYTPILQEEVATLIRNVSSISATSEVVNLSKLVLTFTCYNAARILFGKRYEDEEMFNTEFYNLLHEAEGMLQAFFYSDYFPFGGLLDKLTGKTSRLEKTFKGMDTFLGKVIDDHLANNKLKSTEQEDIVDVLLRLMNDTSFPVKLEVENIKAILSNIFMGGANTATAGIIWALTELVKNPIPMKKVQEELREVGVNKGYIEESHIRKLEYFKAVVAETFRLHPPAPLLIPREAVQKSNIEGYEILPKTTVVFNAWSIGRDPEYWTTDPDLFIPDRFLGESVDIRGQSVQGMFPFGGGRRKCPGYNFGVANLELALANLLYSFNWELPPAFNNHHIDNNVLPGLIMHKQNQLCLVAKKF